MKNKKGFTLIELLAVITIMGILMLVAIPAVSRTIENSRRNTMATTIKTYIDAVRTAVIGDEIKCGTDMISAVGAGDYYVAINGPGDWMQTGGVSPWGNATIGGYIKITKSIESNGTEKYTYSAILNDKKHGLESAAGSNPETAEEDITRSNIKTNLTLTDFVAVPSGKTTCTMFS